MSCPTGKQWYVCSKGDFHGCCSVDPCGDGICPDTVTISGGRPQTTNAVSSPTSSSTESATSAGASPAVTVTSIPTQTGTGTDKATDTSTGSVTRTSASASTDSSPPSKTLIGGVVGGVVGAGIILGLLVWLFCRRRKRQNFQQERRKRQTEKDEPRFMLLRSSSRDNRRGRDRDVARAMGRKPRGLVNDPNRCSTYTTTTSSKHPSSLDYYSSSSSTTTTPESRNLHSTPSINNSNSASASARNSFLPSIPPTTQLFIPGPGSGPAPGVNPVPSANTTDPGKQYQHLTPELPDTGFYRQPAELATSSHSELINVPVEQRNTGAGTGAGLAQSVVTEDGVVLGPNLERDREKKGSGKRSANGKGHVMSFMQYDSSSSMSGSGSGSGSGAGVGLGVKFDHHHPRR